MKKSDKKKQHKALKRRAKAKEARAKERALGPMSPLRHIRQARHYPIEGCWVQTGWDEDGLAVVVVARRQPDGNVAFGCYLVDYYCLGVKDAYCNANVPPGEIRRHHLPQMLRAGKPIEISPALAHEIVYGGIEYAAKFGFRPHRDFRLAQNVLDASDTHPRSGTVEFGKDGKPLYISGPYDNPDAIIRRLTRTAGEGTFHFLTRVDGPPTDDWSKEW